MVGLGRLDDLQACVESVVADGVEGDLIEAGAWRGGASMLMRATLDTPRRRRARSGSPTRSQGFPADERATARRPGQRYDFLAAPLEEVRDSFARLGLDARRRASCPGFFEETLPALAGRRWALVRLDADTYEPTRLALRLPLPRPRARRLPGPRRLRLVRGLPPGGRRVPRASTGSPSRSSGSTPPASRWRRESAAPIEIAASERRGPRRAAVDRARATRTCRPRARSSSREAASCAAARRRPRRARRAAAHGCGGRLGAMIVFASSITDPGRCTQRARSRGIRLAAEPDSEVLANAAAGLDLPLLQPDPGQRRRARRPRGARARCTRTPRSPSPRLLRHGCAARSRDPDVGVVGCVGAVGVRSIAWWEGSVTWASFTHRYDELGGGELPALSWRRDELPAYAQTGEVDTVDGFVLALSPWVGAQRALRRVARPAARLRLRLLPAGARRRAQGRDRGLPASSTTTRSTWSATRRPGSRRTCASRRSGTAACRASAPPAGGWQQRARRAEAEAALARTQAVAAMLQADARDVAARARARRGDREHELARSPRRCAGSTRFAGHAAAR